jgi:uracil-DNA glycosylase
MGADQFHRWDEMAASALDWWHDAGVDTLVQDDPRDWLAPPAPAVTTPVAVRSDPVPNAPTDYAGFWSWRLGDDAPEQEWGVATLPPEGPLDADLLVLVDHANDETLLGGLEGALFDRILTAIGRNRADVCIAALAHARPLADTLTADVVPQLAERAGLLLSLTPAKTVLLVGHATSRAMLTTDGAPVPVGLHGINQHGREIQALAIAHPRFMLKHPQVKRETWRCLQSLLGGQA